MTMMAAIHATNPEFIAFILHFYTEFDSMLVNINFNCYSTGNLWGWILRGWILWSSKEMVLFLSRFSGSLSIESITSPLVQFRFR